MLTSSVSGYSEFFTDAIKLIDEEQKLRLDSVRERNKYWEKQNDFFDAFYGEKSIEGIN